MKKRVKVIRTNKTPKTFFKSILFLKTKDVGFSITKNKETLEIEFNIGFRDYTFYAIDLERDFEISTYFNDLIQNISSGTTRELLIDETNDEYGTFIDLRAKIPTGEYRCLRLDLSK